MFISANYQDNYHKVGNCGVHNIPSNDLRDEENLFFGNCYSSHYGYTSDDDGSETWCNEQYVCILGPSCSDNRQQMNHCWLGENGLINPFLAGWGPVLLFGAVVVIEFKYLRM